MIENKFVANDDMFGVYVKIPTGTSMAMNIYKVVGRIESNGYCDVPIMTGMRAVLHSEIVPVLNVVHCGVSEDTIIRVALSDCEIVPPPNAPLTLEELREMDGEPVWIKSCRNEKSGKHVILDGYDQVLHCLHVIGGGLLDCTVMGKTWLAYRRKPEEV